MNHDVTPSSLTHEAITMRARKLWASAGSPSDRDLEFWLAAETELRNERVPRTGTTSLPDRPPHRRRR
ncbi:MAG TPA: DUF2934 domain-containing protein [Opitutaceae bacterium]|nr:DUF2934 domain-containing protein [Opitutaceae bacterium]